MAALPEEGLPNWENYPKKAQTQQIQKLLQVGHVGKLNYRFLGEGRHKFCRDRQISKHKGPRMVEFWDFRCESLAVPEQ